MKYKVVIFLIILTAGFVLGRVTTPSINSKSEIMPSDLIKEKTNEGTPFDFEVISLQKKQDKRVSATINKKRAYKYFDNKKNSSAKIETILNKINSQDLPIENGEVNMEIIDLYEDALAIDPNSAKTLHGYSNYLIGLQRYDEAKQLINKCLTVDPGNHGCLGNSTIYALNDGNPVKIDQKINHCLKLSPENVQCLHNKANSFLAKGEAKRAIEFLKKLEHVNGSHNIHFSNSIINLGYAQAYEQLKLFEMANNYYKHSCNEGYEYACSRIKDL